jgi:hypothetical protein
MGASYVLVLDSVEGAMRRCAGVAQAPASQLVQVELNMFRNSLNSPINDRQMRRIITVVILFPSPHLVPGPQLSRHLHMSPKHGVNMVNLHKLLSDLASLRITHQLAANRRDFGILSTGSHAKLLHLPRYFLRSPALPKIHAFWCIAQILYCSVMYRLARLSCPAHTEFALIGHGACTDFDPSTLTPHCALPPQRWQPCIAY